MRSVQKPVPLIFFFCFALFSLIFSTAFFPNIRFLHFSPFFAILIQRKSLISTLWIGSLCGLILDTVCSETQFGIFSLCSCLTLLICFRLRQYFFEEKIFSIPFFTGCISLVFSGLQLFILHPLTSYPVIKVAFFFLIMPLFDALYAFLWFTCPSLLYNLLSSFKRG